MPVLTTTHLLDELESLASPLKGCEDGSAYENDRNKTDHKFVSFL
jgi:hypothetical protein